MKPIKLSLATELSLGFFAGATAALVTLLILERNKFNRSIEHLAYATKIAEDLTHETKNLQFKVTYYEHELKKIISDVNNLETNLPVQVTALEQRLRTIECKHN